MAIRLQRRCATGERRFHSAVDGGMLAVDCTGYRFELVGLLDWSLPFTAP